MKRWGRSFFNSCHKHIFVYNKLWIWKSVENWRHWIIKCITRQQRLWRSFVPHFHLIGHLCNVNKSILATVILSDIPALISYLWESKNCSVTILTFTDYNMSIEVWSYICISRFCKHAEHYLATLCIYIVCRNLMLSGEVVTCTGQ